MTTPLKTLAIQKALSNDWEEAKSLNEEILTLNPQDIDTLNRLGFAFMKLGKYNKARDTYKKVIVLDKTNPIAVKNLKRLETVSKSGKDGIVPSTHTISTDTYIEEAGKTKTVELKNVADKKTLSLFEPGDPITIVVKRSKIFAQSNDKKYLGMLPDNVSMRLITFMKGGNEYSACVKAVDEKSITIFIKETKKVSKFKNQASFSNSHQNQDE
ncbi:MAG: tetratricopeptide repeat protein [Candidatus Levybacteria bacterium]|nr:tetratricopeptide repeat protein [Candidatus Levybacteria bacterium]